MRKYRFSTKASDPRVLCVSIRDISPIISRCIQFELEDLIASIDAVDVIAPGELTAPQDAGTATQKGVLTLQRLAAKALRRLKVKAEGVVPAAGRRRLPPGVTPDYEMLFVSVEAPGDLYDLAPCAMWRSAARVSVCYINELYVSDVRTLGGILKILKQFDYIFVGMSGTVETLAEATGRPCHLSCPVDGHAQILPVSTIPGAGHRHLCDGASSSRDAQGAAPHGGGGTGTTVRHGGQHSRLQSHRASKPPGGNDQAIAVLPSERRVVAQRESHKTAIRSWRIALSRGWLLEDRCSSAKAPRSATFDQYFGWPRLGHSGQI